MLSILFEFASSLHVVVAGMADRKVFRTGRGGESTPCPLDRNILAVRLLAPAGVFLVNTRRHA
jgi:hypothetical protein